MQNHRTLQAPADTSLEAALRRELRRCQELEQRRLRLYREIEDEDRDFADFLAASGQEEIVETLTLPSPESEHDAGCPEPGLPRPDPKSRGEWFPVGYALRT